MNIFVYADESGVLDPKHNEYFVFGGLIFLGKDAKDELSVSIAMLKMSCVRQTLVWHPSGS